MTEQPVETEQEFLGNVPRRPYLPSLVQMDLAEREAASDGVFALGSDLPIRVFTADQPLPGTPGADLMLTAEQHAQSAVMALSCGELDEGIAWLQSALAFAQNHRHAEEARLAHRTITTLEELDALPCESVIRDAEGHVLERWGEPEENLWVTVMVKDYISRGDIALPATVLLDPEAAK
ncbi:hypothetical protein QEO76_gp56 [Arthrobacter phage Cole]|uniref:Uncharacterized protein n=1 Tax=Arthrobacter phage Cole TaxID=2944951 RepID=A0A9E7J7I8_9CAUD|nr:hypothetical protein QEO76_gp56 [Arthrobacter phage Cole]URC18081.1 hypothetical protein SEA_COLE_44 [Arthrobacter phage Cole]